MNPSEVQAFAQQLTALQRSLYLYVIGLVHSPVDAEDVLQETNRVIWEKCDDYRPGSNFAAWAYKIAYFEVLAFRKRQQRDRLRFGEELLQKLSEEWVETPPEIDTHQSALVRCLEKLRTVDRELISFRYIAGEKVEELARRLSRSEKSIYQSLARIRDQLLDCVHDSLAKEAIG